MSETGFRAGVAVLAIAVAAVFVRLSFCGAVELPPLPPRPKARPVAAAAVSAAVDTDPTVYAEQLVTDSRALRVEPPVTPADMSHAFTFAASDHRFALAPGRHHDSADVLGLHLTLQVEDIEGTTHRQMVLTVQNKTSDFLAYRVDTRPSQGTRPCFEKADYAHDAVGLAPGEKARRSECVYRSGWRLFVDRVETAIVPRLSYYYLSAVPPAALGLELLPSRGHQPAGGRPICQIFHPAELQTAIRSGETSWRDLVDFYGRHSCQTFVFPPGYKAFQHDGERPLPAVTVRP